MLQLNSYADVASVPNNYTYVSEKKRARYFWTLIFGLISGDLNPIHINPLTSKNYKSKLKGLARHGISTIAQAESFIFKILSFTEDTEIIAKGYNSIRYTRPVNMGDSITYTYVLLGKKVIEDKKQSECVWQIKGVNQNGKDIFIAEWIILYSAVEKNIITTEISPLPLFTPPMQIEDTPIRIFLLRMFILLAVCVIAFMLYINRNG
jgi:acyl dehydratase